MKCVRPLGLVLVITGITLVRAVPADVTITPRSPPSIGETIEHVSKQLIDNNGTDNVILDVRTPPKIKVHKKKDKIPSMESSHAGVAIPVDADNFNLEESPENTNFFKIERPTTNSGLSTWILLSGQASTRKPEDASNAEKNMTLFINENINKISKPLFKKRSTTTRRPQTTSTSFQTTESTSSHKTTKDPKEATKFTKIKASILTNAFNRKNDKITNNTRTTPLAKKQYATTTAKTVSTTPMKTEKTTKYSEIKTTKYINNKAIEKISEVTPTTVSILRKEAKEGDAELPTTSSKKTKKSSNKRKKNKNRRRRPTSSKNDTEVTKVDKIKDIEKPISTELYNYLSREIMPTVGVGLVGLLVTAGLASYFLYPFGIARRSFEVDRRDKEGTYYYNDEYSGGIREEEAIGKVIAGMVSDTFFNNNYKSQSSRNTYPTVRYKKNDQTPQRQQHTIQGSVENVHLTSSGNNYEDPYIRQPSYQPSVYNNRIYNQDVIEKSKETGYTVADQKFVVGGIQKSAFEEVTPVTVPEHGPRRMRRGRRKRNIIEENELDNEISYDKYRVRPQSASKTPVFVATTTIASTETEMPSSTPKDEGFPTEKQENVTLTTTTSTYNETTQITQTTEQPASLIDLLADLLRIKINLGLQIIHNTTLSIAQYVSRVQSRLNEQYNVTSTHPYHY